MSTSQDGPPQDNSANYFRRLSQQKEESPQPILKSTRITTGLIIGALLGTTYGFVTQFINSIFTPGVPYALYPFGPVGNLIASVVIWAGIGGLCAAPDSGTYGIMAGSLAMAGVATIRIWTTLIQTEVWSFQAAITAGTLLSSVIAFLIGIPLMLVVRWAVEVQHELALKPLWAWHRLRAPLAAMALLGVVTGVFTLYPGDVRQGMRGMQALIEQGLNATRPDDFPAALRSDRITDFLTNATRSYTLEQSFDENLRKDVETILYSEFTASPLILARFSNGWQLVCLVNSQTKAARCRSYPAMLK
jgi:hypothetical protein